MDVELLERRDVARGARLGGEAREEGQVARGASYRRKISGEQTTGGAPPLVRHEAQVASEAAGTQQLGVGLASGLHGQHPTGQGEEGASQPSDPPVEPPAKLLGSSVPPLPREALVS